MSDRLSEDQKTLLGKVPVDGSSIGNKSLRQSLGWSEEKYWEVRNPLIDQEILGLGRGKGGSIFRTDVRPSDEIKPEVEPVAPSSRAESSLYAPLADVLQAKWSKELKFEQFIVQVTAMQGRRDTGGTWTRPDIVVVNVANYLNLPGKFVDVITFEVKTGDGLDITGVYEALSHLRAGTRAYLIASMSEEERKDKRELVQSISEEASRHGVGFIIAPEDVNNYSEWEFLVEASQEQGVPSRIDDFLETQLTDENKKKLRKYVK